MSRRSLLLPSFTLLFATVACSKAEEVPAGSSNEAKAAKTEAEVPKTDAPADAAGGAVAPGQTASDCPKSLAGTDEVSRVIKKECGEVQVTETYVVEGTLTLEAGARLAFADGASLEVGKWKPGKLVVAGTKEEPVVLTARGDKVAGVWGGLLLGDNAARSKVEHLVVEFAGAGETPAMRITGPDVSVDGLVVRDTKHVGLHVADVAGASITNAAFQRGPERVAEVHPNALAALGPAIFDPNMKIRVLDGVVTRESAWPDHGAPLLLTGEVEVEGREGAQTRLTIAAGSELRFDGSGHITVGKWEPAKLVVAGTAEAPVKLTNLTDAPGAMWAGLTVGNRGELELTHGHLAFGGKDDGGTVLVQSNGTAMIKASKFSDTAQGVVARSEGSTLAVETTTFERVATPYVLHPNLVSGLLAGNVYDATSSARIEAGNVVEDATWTLQSIPMVFLGELTVEKVKLVIPAGFVGRFERGAKMIVGTWDATELTAVGTVEAPIILAGVVDEPSVWGPLALNGNTTRAELVHVELRGTSGVAAIEVARDAVVTLTHVKGAKLEGAIVKAECGSKLTATDLVAAEGTPKTKIDPEGC